MKTLACAMLIVASMAPVSAHARIPQVQHVIIIFQENRTPDNLLCGFRSRMPGADLACSGLNSRNRTIQLTQGPLISTYDVDHFHTSFRLMYNGGLMNGADRIHCKPNPGKTCPANASYRYVRTTDVRPYFQIAKNYGFANRMFQSNKGPSFPAHQFIISGTSAPTATSMEFASGQPSPVPTVGGCIAPASATVKLIGPDGLEDSSTYPCFEHRTLMDLLDNPPGGQAPISWRYYATRADSQWTAPNAIRHICSRSSTPPPICSNAPARPGPRTWCSIPPWC